jgi:hypothetical protein
LERPKARRTILKRRAQGVRLCYHFDKLADAFIRQLFFVGLVGIEIIGTRPLGFPPIATYSLNDINTFGIRNHPHTFLLPLFA